MKNILSISDYSVSLVVQIVVIVIFANHHESMWDRDLRNLQKVHPQESRPWQLQPQPARRILGLNQQIAGSDHLVGRARMTGGDFLLEGFDYIWCH